MCQAILRARQDIKTRLVAPHADEYGTASYTKTKSGEHSMTITVRDAESVDACVRDALTVLCTMAGDNVLLREMLGELE